MRPLKIKISVTLDEPLVDKIRIMAEEDDRSLSQFVNIVLKKYVAEKEAENEKA